MAWTCSSRRSRLPPGWPALRLETLRRDGWRCQIPGDDGALCLELANEVDHVIAGDNHDPQNLRAACRTCHARKSSAEGRAAWAAKRPTTH